MSFLKQILSPFVVFEEDSKTPPAKENKPVAAPPTPVTPVTPLAPWVTPVVPVPRVDENVQHPLVTGNSHAAPAQTLTYSPNGAIAKSLPEHVQYFERLIEEANAKNPLFQGADYKEFIDSKVDIDDITDEVLKYRTAFNILKSTGLTKEKILSTGQEYMNLIGRDLNTFQSAHNQQYQKDVRPKEEQVQKKAEELQALTQKINALKKDINELTQEINLTKEKLNTTKNSFLLAGENKQKEIQSELQKIAQYF